MLNWLLRRVSEPSTWAGLASIIGGVGIVAKVDEAPAMAGAIAQAGPEIASGNYIGGGMILAGALAAIFGEKGKR